MNCQPLAHSYQQRVYFSWLIENCALNARVLILALDYVFSGTHVRTPPVTRVRMEEICSPYYLDLG